MADIGLIGLGTMGAALSLNIAEKGFDIAVFNRTTARTRAFHDRAGDLAPRIRPTESLEAFVAAIDVPRRILLMVPAGDAVDDQIAALLPLLDADDLIIDAGNANFQDTRRRAEAALEDGRPYLGIGVSGGEDGARHGPSIMGGGPRKAWDLAAPVLTAIAARFEDAPCADWMGPDGAGHFVKTVHNGIEYADMQMIAEAYGVMRDGLSMSAADIGDVFARWNEGPLQSYLIEISAAVAATQDPETGQPMLDVILDSAGQKGTGRWTAIEALLLGAPATAIEAAVAARNLSARREERARGEEILGVPTRHDLGDPGQVIDALEHALIAGKIACYAQGFGLLAQASTEYDWDLSLPDAARVWRAGCIIRSAMLDDMAAALTGAPNQNLLFAPYFADRVKAAAPGLRRSVAMAAEQALPMPALSAALAYLDMLHQARGTANMLQGQRDYFGAHGFKRVDADGDHHGPWHD
ncbi:MAG: NADP-dependent phosphogluconate dehydrogenase [Pseudomonadota bacterium]